MMVNLMLGLEEEVKMTETSGVLGDHDGHRQKWKMQEEGLDQG
jgi:hypothetical protein